VLFSLITARPIEESQGTEEALLFSRGKERLPSHDWILKIPKQEGQ
jgi:hypothetical protein